MSIFESDTDNNSAPSDIESIPEGCEARFCDHENPVCTCNTSESERATFLREYLDSLAEGGWSNAQLMPLGEEGKGPIIEGRCYLDTDEARSLLVDGETAIRRIEEGTRGFYLYAGKPEHGTTGLVFTDHDDPDRFPADAGTLTVVSGSGTGYHQTFSNVGGAQNAKGKGDLSKAGEVRAHNQYVVLPGSIHPSGGIFEPASHSPGSERQRAIRNVSRGSNRGERPVLLAPATDAL